MKYLLGIPVVNRASLLRRALRSVESAWPSTLIIDNRDEPLHGDWPVSVFRPSVPLSFSQTMNLLHQLASQRSCDVLILMHNDAEAGPGAFEELVRAAEEATSSDRRWGAIFTNHDALAAFSMKMHDDVGKWDTVLPQYFADNDYYRRMVLAGYEVSHSDLVVHHKVSQTFRSDRRREFLIHLTHPMYEMYYRKKWGGLPGNERFEQPFDGALDSL